MGRHCNGPRVRQRGKSNVWYTIFPDGHGENIYIRIHNEKNQKIPSTATETEAKVHAWRIYHEWRRSRAENPERTNTLGELTDRYLKSRVNTWATGTLKRYACFMERLEKVLGADINVKNIDLACAEDLLNTLQQTTDWSLSTLRKFKQFCGALFTYGVNLRWVDSNPFLLIVLPKDIGQPNGPSPFSEDEIRDILQVARTHPKFTWFYPAVTIAVTTGARRSEICKLCVKDFDPVTGILTFPAEITKTRVENKVRLPEFARERLTQCIAGKDLDEPLIIKPSGKPLRTRDFDLSCKEGRDSPRIWRQLLTAAQIELRGVHKVRSALITNLVNSGRFTIAEAVSITGQTIRTAEYNYLKKRLDRQEPVVDYLEVTFGAGHISPSGSQCRIVEIST